MASATNKEYGIITFGSNHFGEISGPLGHSYMRIEGDWARIHIVTGKQIGRAHV